jgi:hypothetical protein
METLYCGPVPANESCEQLGPNYDPKRARLECQTYIAQLRRQFGPEPDGASLRIKSESHDFGTYLEVVCKFDSSDETATAYALQCEGEAATEWDEESKAVLALPVAPLYTTI